jgi:predicted enzyme related to lactoylglutathione lyase
VEAAVDGAPASLHHAAPRHLNQENAMDVYKTHGAFSWSELMTSDTAGASEFYGKLFGWVIKDMGPQMGHYRVANIGETGVGGLMAIPAEAKGMPPRWGVYVTVDNVDATLEQAKALGAQVCMGPMDVPGVGRMAGFNDPQGAMISVIQYLPRG